MTLDNFFVNIGNPFPMQFLFSFFFPQNFLFVSLFHEDKPNKNHINYQWRTNKTKNKSKREQNPTNWELTLELLACRKSCDINFKIIADGGRRCIRALHTRLAPAPPCRHRPLIICIVRSSKLSRGRRVIKLINSFRFSSATSALHSEESRVRSKESKQGWTRAKLSEDRRDCSNCMTPCRRWRQFYGGGERRGWKKEKQKLVGANYNNNKLCY